MVNQSLVALCLLCVSSLAGATASLFGYQQTEKTNLDIFPQWLSVLERHLEEMAPAGDCRQTEFNQCHLKAWSQFLDSIRKQPAVEQIRLVNQYANAKKYILDLENYGVVDYWATPLQFLDQSGDCEDYAIIKMLSLKKLGFEQSHMRIVVVQDTNLRIPHAVMSLQTPEDIKILDNQIEEVISHQDIFHYIPVYSINENHWWMHLPQL